MALKTPEQFEESLKKLNPKVFMNGKRVESVLTNPNTKTVVESIRRATLGPWTLVTRIS